MVTQKLEEKVQQHDEVVESSKTGCRSQSRAQGKAYEQVPALICGTCARRILRAATICGGQFALYEQNNPPKYLGNKSEIPHLNFTTPPFVSKCGNPPFQTLRFPMILYISRFDSHPELLNLFLAQVNVTMRKPSPTLGRLLTFFCVYEVFL